MTWSGTPIESENPTDRVVGIKVCLGWLFPAVDLHPTSDIGSIDIKV